MQLSKPMKPSITILTSEDLNATTSDRGVDTSVQILSARVNNSQRQRANTTYNDLLQSLFSPHNGMERKHKGSMVETPPISVSKEDEKHQHQSST